jgi:hypothetical protein
VRFAAQHAAALGGVARTLGFRFGPHVNAAVPLLAGKCAGTADASDDEEAELREAALHALANIVQFCPEVCAALLFPLTQALSLLRAAAAKHARPALAQATGRHATC